MLLQVGIMFDQETYDIVDYNRLLHNLVINRFARSGQRWLVSCINVIKYNLTIVASDRTP